MQPKSPFFKGGLYSDAYSSPPLLKGVRGDLWFYGWGKNFRPRFNVRPQPALVPAPASPRLSYLQLH